MIFPLISNYHDDRVWARGVGDRALIERRLVMKYTVSTLSVKEGLCPGAGRGEDIDLDDCNPLSNDMLLGVVVAGRDKQLRDFGDVKSSLEPVELIPVRLCVEVLEIEIEGSLHLLLSSLEELSSKLRAVTVEPVELHDSV